MKVIIQNSQRQHPQIGELYGGGSRSITEFLVGDKDIAFDIRMVSDSGFYLPVDCDVDMEIKFTIIPKPQYPVIKIFK